MSKKCHLDGLKLDFFFLKVHLTSISNLFEVSTFDVEEATTTVTRSGGISHVRVGISIYMEMILNIARSYKLFYSINIFSVS